MKDRRKERRFDLPETCREYFEMRVKADEAAFFAAQLLDFSRHGVRFRCPGHLQVGSSIECTLSIPKAVSSREITLILLVRHSQQLGDQFVTGCEVEAVSSEVWFRVFEKVYDFIIERAGDVY